MRETMLPAFAQGLITKKRLSAALAMEAVMEAVDACKKAGYAVTAIVVDNEGVRQAVIRGDGATVHTLDSAYAKAYTAASLAPVRKDGSTKSLSERIVSGQVRVLQRLIEAGDRPPVHVLVLTVPAVDPHDGALVTERGRVGRRSAERLGPVGGQATGVVGLEAVVERVTHDRVRQHPLVPGGREAQQPGVAPGRVVQAAHDGRMPASST